MFNKKFLEILPEVLVDQIADYHDYNRYCKPQHKLKYSLVMEDIISMSEIIIPTLMPSIAKACWGPLSYLIEDIDWDIEEDEF